jgi:predicted nucleic acid-binding protein
MILVDTSVLIAYLRTADSKLLSLFRSRPVAICGVTRAEILHGARSPAERANLLTFLNAFQLVPIPEPLWDVIGDNLATLRSAGFTIPFQDVIIATVAIEHDLELWTRDQQFTMIQPVLSRLRLFVEPP